MIRFIEQIKLSIRNLSLDLNPNFKILKNEFTEIINSTKT